MNKLDSREALNDICRRCGLSEDIVRRVQRAETEYVLENLKLGRSVNLPGRGTFRTEVKSRLAIGGEPVIYLKPRFTVSNVIKNELQDCTDFVDEIEDEDEEEELPEGIMSLQIPSLT